MKYRNDQRLGSTWLSHSGFAAVPADRVPASRSRSFWFEEYGSEWSDASEWGDEVSTPGWADPEEEWPRSDVSFDLHAGGRR